MTLLYKIKKKLIIILIDQKLHSLNHIWELVKLNVYKNN